MTQFRIKTIFILYIGMDFADILSLIIQLALVFVLVLILYEIYNKYTVNQHKGRGYSSIDSEYIYPVLHPDFVTPDENDYILKNAGPMFRESLLVSGSLENVRQSKTAWLSRDDPVVANIIHRVCSLTNLPFENAEKMQVVEYEPNGYYRPHYDASCDDKEECVEFEKNGGQRIVTMLIYLNDQYEGGATHFPKLNTSYKPPKNTALLFYSLEKNGGKCHPLSLHAGTPVISGKKYIANIWLREHAYDVNK